VALAAAAGLAGCKHEPEPPVITRLDLGGAAAIAVVERSDTGRALLDAASLRELTADGARLLVWTGVGEDDRVANVGGDPRLVSNVLLR